MLQLSLQKLVEKSHMSERQSVSAVLNAEPQLDWFLDIFTISLVSFLQGTYKKRIKSCKIILTPTTKVPKICHALAATSAFNLKLCLMQVEQI